MSDGLCPGSCNSAYRKARALYDAEHAAYTAKLERLADGDPVPDPPHPPDTRPWYGDPVWCTRCQHIIHTELAELDELAAHLAALPPGIRPAVSGPHDHVKVSGTRNPGSPSPAMDALDELAGWLRDWEATAQGDETLPRTGYLAMAITSSVKWLTAHFAPMVTNLDYAADFGHEIRAWHRVLATATHAGSASKHVKQPCPRCGLYCLWEDLGADYIRCVNPDCNRRLTREELEAQSSAGAA